MLRLTSSFSFLIVLTLAVLAFPSYLQAQAPLISTVTPASGVPGTQVTVTGSYFGASQGSGNVSIGGKYGIALLSGYKLNRINWLE